MGKYVFAYALTTLLIGLGVFIVGRQSYRSRDIKLKP